MAIEYAAKMTNGIHRVRIDAAERVITVIASAGWRVEVLPGKSGSTLQEIGGPVRIAELADAGALASMPEARSFLCIEGRS